MHLNIYLLIKFLYIFIPHNLINFFYLIWIWIELSWLYGSGSCDKRQATFRHVILLHVILRHVTLWLLTFVACDICGMSNSRQIMLRHLNLVKIWRSQKKYKKLVVLLESFLWQITDVMPSLPRDVGKG